MEDSLDQFLEGYGFHPFKYLRGRQDDAKKLLAFLTFNEITERGFDSTFDLLSFLAEEYDDLVSICFDKDISEAYENLKDFVNNTEWKDGVTEDSMTLECWREQLSSEYSRDQYKRMAGIMELANSEEKLIAKISEFYDGTN